MNTSAKFQLFHFRTGVIGLFYNKTLTAGNTFTKELTDMLGLLIHVTTGMSLYWQLKVNGTRYQGMSSSYVTTDCNDTNQFSFIKQSFLVYIFCPFSPLSYRHQYNYHVKYSSRFFHTITLQKLMKNTLYKHRNMNTGICSLNTAVKLLTEN